MSSTSTTRPHRASVDLDQLHDILVRAHDIAYHLPVTSDTDILLALLEGAMTMLPPRAIDAAQRRPQEQERAR